jgi:hypothetical protein
MVAEFKPPTTIQDASGLNLGLEHGSIFEIVAYQSAAYR